jgi:hypothetical protein
MREKNGKTYGQTYVFGFQCVNKNIEGWLFRFCISSGLQPDVAKPTNGNHHFLYKQKTSLEKTLLGINSTNVHTCTLYNSMINKVHSHLALRILGLTPLTP